MLSTLTRISDFDLFLIAQGRHERLWEVLGAHVEGTGTRFAVWAPNARDVQVAGDFTGWSGVPLERVGSSGVWFGHVDGAAAGDRYKYRIHGADGRWMDKADPLARATEAPPRTASVI